MGDSPKWVKSKRRREKERKKERLNDGNNNGQATHGAGMAHASRLGQKRHFIGKTVYLMILTYILPPRKSREEILSLKQFLYFC